MTKATRYEFFILSITAALTGAVLYGLVSIAVILTGNHPWEMSAWGNFLIPPLMGGYFFFGLSSGVMFTARWVSAQTLKRKILLTVFFIIPLQLAMWGIIYCIPYGIYNFVCYRKTPKENKENTVGEKTQKNH